MVSEAREPDLLELRENRKKKAPAQAGLFRFYRSLENLTARLATDELALDLIAKDPFLRILGLRNVAPIARVGEACEETGDAAKGVHGDIVLSMRTRLSCKSRVPYCVQPYARAAWLRSVKVAKFVPFNRVGSERGRRTSRRVAAGVNISRKTLLGALGFFIGVALAPAAPLLAANPEPHVMILTDQGAIEVALDAKRAPISSANFLRNVDSKFYNGGTFFRAVPGFVIQGGHRERETPNDATIPLEPTTKTGLKHLDGTLSMARTSEPNSATSEFFICVGPQSALDASSPASPGYAAFGHVVRGMEVVRKIVALPAENQQLDKPVRIIKMYRKGRS